MNKFNSDYEEYLEKNGIGVEKNNYVIWYQSDSTRINDIKEFYERMKHDYKNVEYFEIIFD